MTSFGNSRGIALRDRPWRATRESGETKGRRLFLPVGRTLGRVALNASSAGKKKSSRVWRLLVGRVCPGREGASSRFLKAEDEIPTWRVSSLVRIMLIFLLPAGATGCVEREPQRAPPAGPAPPFLPGKAQEPEKKTRNQSREAARLPTS